MNFNNANYVDDPWGLGYKIALVFNAKEFKMKVLLFDDYMTFLNSD